MFWGLKLALLWLCQAAKSQRASFLESLSEGVRPEKIGGKDEERRSCAMSRADDF